MMGARFKPGRKRRPPAAWRGAIPVIIGAAILALVALMLWPDNGGTAGTPPLNGPNGNPVPGFDQIEDGIHLRTGFRDGEGLMAVVTNCTPCHSARLVTQNRMTREGWEQTIRWMQKTQNLWDLGANEAIILDYLAAHYAPEKKGRRQNLENIEWYELDP
jgi:hypothetical protein